jgi:hypothetical protein
VLTLDDIGRVCGPSPQLDEASAANTAALTEHEAGHYEASRDGFARAVALAPEWSIPRFNQACALARLGDLGAAAEVIEPALLRDLPAILPRLARDADLAALREVPTFRARVEEIRALYARAADGGLTAQCRAEWGYYLRALDRFVPLARADGGFGVIDAAHGRVAVIAAGVVGELESDEVFAVEGMEVVPFVPLTGAWEPAPSIHFEVPAGYGASSDPTELVRGIDVSAAAVRFRVGGCSQEWCVISGRDLVAADRDTAAPDPPASVPPPGYALVRDDLQVPEGDPIPLGRGHASADWHTFALDPSGRALVIASNDMVLANGTYLALEQTGDLHHTVFDHVDLRTRVVTRLGEGDSTGYVVADGDDCYTVLGAPLHAGGASVRRWRAFSASEPEEITGLVPPLRP